MGVEFYTWENDAGEGNNIILAHFSSASFSLVFYWRNLQPKKRGETCSFLFSIAV
tara:strand:+ start:373 stop:537 length:165 start_codon:yes stop_codon:yes gene_type:complete